MRCVPLLVGVLALLAPARTGAAPLPLRTLKGPAPLAVFDRAERVTVDAGAWRVVDASGRTIARGKRGAALPTGRYGAFRLLPNGGAPVSYAVIPDVAVRRTDRTSPFAMGAYFSMRFSPENLPRAAALFTRMGATASRDELRWDLVEPQPGRWTWDAFDRGMVAQHDHHIEPLGLLDYWGAYVKDRPERASSLAAFSPEAVRAFANYCTQMVRRYKPGGTLARKMGWKDGWGVRHWEVWNEPATFWSGTPEQFGTLLKAAHAAIVAEQPDAVVHFSNIGPEWDAKAIHVAGFNAFEGLTPHYYCPPRSPDEAGMDRQMRETVLWYRARGLRKNLWVSEVGWDTSRNPQQEARQAQYLVRAYAMALDAGMDRVFWYDFRDDGPDGPAGPDAENTWYGVVNRDLTPKTSYAAYAAMVARLRDKAPAGRANLGGAVSAILFAGKGGSTAVLWADGADATLALPPGTSLYDTFGNVQTGHVPLGDWPVYVVARGRSAAWLKKRIEAAPVRGIPPLRLEPVQFLRRAGASFLRVRVTNEGPKALAGTLAAGEGSTVALDLAPDAVATVEVPAPAPKTLTRRLDQPVRLTFTPRGGKASETLEGTAPDPLVPHSVREAPTMDEFWATAPVARLDTRRYVVGLVPWSPSDLSAAAQVQYDETGLWLRLQVTDDVFYQPNTGNTIWEADSVQVAVQASGRAKAPVHEFGYALTPEGAKGFRYGGSGGAGDVDIQHDGTTVLYDIRIPWAELSPLSGAPGERFRMDFMVNDNDGHGRRGWLELTPGIGTGNDPSRWLEWTLSQTAP